MNIPLPVKFVLIVWNCIERMGTEADRIKILIEILHVREMISN